MIAGGGLTGTINAIAPAMGDHLWQSTVFAVLVAGLTLGFRSNRAGVRFGLWLAASIKFLMPFSWLISLGGVLAPRVSVQAMQAEPYLVFEQVGQPFTRTVVASFRLTALLGMLPTVLAVLWLLGTVAMVTLWISRWMRVSSLKRRAVLMAEGREVDALCSLKRLMAVRQPVGLRVSAESMEPAVFGMLQPTLVWPARMSDQLSEAQLQSILAHELWHVRRRDNLISALHMVVEAVFWFHPLVWWVGARLVEERERACDEEVLRLGNDADVYAESLLRACKFCLESPLKCVSGVAGSNLTRRIGRIMNGQSSQKLSLSRRVVLAAAALTVVAGPVLFGVLHAPRLSAQVIQGAMQGPGSLSAASHAPAASFDTISIKRAEPGEQANKLLIQVGDHTLNFTRVSVKDLIKFAYGIESYQIQDAPTWSGSERYDIVGTWKDSPGYAAEVKAMPGPPPPPAPAGAQSLQMNRLAPFQLQAMVQNMLTTRFGLKTSSQMNDMPVYDLVVANEGAKLTPTPKTPPPASYNGEAIISIRTMIKGTKGEVEMTDGPVSALAGFFSATLDHQVIDKTGIDGSYNITLHWNPEQSSVASLSESLEEQLGLKLEPQHGPVKVLVVNQLEKPVAD